MYKYTKNRAPNLTNYPNPKFLNPSLMKHELPNKKLTPTTNPYVTNLI